MASRSLPARTSSVSRSMTPSSALMTSIRFSASLRASAAVAADRIGAGASRRCACGLISSFPLAGALGLLQDQRAVDLVGDSDAAGLGKGFRILLGQHRPPDAGARRIAERAFALEAARHLREHRVEEHRLEIGRGRLGLGLRRRRDFCQRVGEIVIRVAVIAGDRGLRGDAAADVVAEARQHHITSISASMAPAALIACRMPIRSRGPMPSPLRPSTSCCNETPSFTTANFLPSSTTLTLLRGVTTVRPRENELGWLTCGLSEME